MKVDLIVLITVVVSAVTSIVSVLVALFIERKYWNKKKEDLHGRLSSTRQSSDMNYSPGLLGVAVPSITEGLARIFDLSGALNENNLAEFVTDLHATDMESTNSDILSQIQQDYFSTIYFLNRQKAMLRRARRAYRVASHLAEMSGEMRIVGSHSPIGEKEAKKEASKI